MTFPPEVCDGVLRRLQVELPLYAYEAWIEPLRTEPHPQGMRVLCPTSFHRDHVRARFLSRIVRLVRDGLGEEARIFLEVCGEDRAESKDPVPARREAAARGDEGEPASVRARVAAVPDARTIARPRSVRRAVRPAGAAARPPGQPVLQGDHTFETFVTGDCNTLAREAAWALASDSSNLSPRHIYLFSRPGLGKTHLSKAVCAEARRSGARRALYASAEAFTNEFVSAVRSRETARFKRKYRHEHDLLVIEDVQFLEGKQSTQLEFFHTVQHLLEAGGRVLLTGNRVPQALNALDPRVQSQVAEGFLAELRTPDAELRRNILRAKAAAGGVHVPDECLEMLVESVRGSVRELESVLIQLVTTALLLKKPIDERLTREALDKKGAEPEPISERVTPEAVIRVVASSFKTSPEAMATRSRRRDVLVPRQLAMYLCRRYTDASLTEIGRAFARNHPSVRNAIDKVEREILERAPLRYQVEALARRLDELAGR